jgi:hypothetical protein
VDERQSKATVEEEPRQQELRGFQSEFPIPYTYIPVFSRFLSHSPP